MLSRGQKQRSSRFLLQYLLIVGASMSRLMQTCTTQLQVNPAWLAELCPKFFGGGLRGRIEPSRYFHECQPSVSGAEIGIQTRTTKVDDSTLTGKRWRENSKIQIIEYQNEIKWKIGKLWRILIREWFIKSYSYENH